MAQKKYKSPFLTCIVKNANKSNIDNLLSEIFQDVK